MANLKDNRNIIIAALDDIDSKSNIWKKKDTYDFLQKDFRPRKKAIDVLIEAAIPVDASDVSGEVKDSNGRTIAMVVDGVIVLL